MDKQFILVLGYGWSGSSAVVDLLKELLKIKEFEYIRLLYLYPDEISDELIELRVGRR